MNICIFGGSFNPVHTGHTEIIQKVKKEYDFDKVIIIPNYNPKYKPALSGASDEDRVKMLGFVFNQADIFTYDIDNKNSYTFNTLTELKKKYPDDNLYFIMGSDSLRTFKEWNNPKIISSLATIICVLRDDDNMAELELIAETYHKKYGGEFIVSNIKPKAVSSSEIRSMVAEGKLSIINGVVNERVYDYIINHQLYTNKPVYKYSQVLELQSLMKDELKKGRYIHTVGVAHTAAQLANRWGYDTNKALIAGMLHDCAKCISDEKRLEICHKNNIPVKPIEEKYPHLLHAKVGAYFAKNKYNIDDEEILHAIEVHTTGCEDMSLLDKIIFIADYIEPGRDQAPHLMQIRKMAYMDLDRCVYNILDDTLKYLGNDTDSIDEETSKAYEYIYQLINNR